MLNKVLEMTILTSKTYPNSIFFGTFNIQESPRCHKRCFILWLSIEKTKDSINLIGEKQMFVRWTFTLEANNQWTL
jgi:hypothetical protein